MYMRKYQRDVLVSCVRSDRRISFKIDNYRKRFIANLQILWFSNLA